MIKVADVRNKFVDLKIASGLFYFCKTVRLITRTMISLMGVFTLYVFTQIQKQGINEKVISQVAESGEQSISMFVSMFVSMVVTMSIVATMVYILFQQIDSSGEKELQTILMALGAGIYVFVCYMVEEQFLAIWLRAEFIMIGFAFLGWLFKYSWDGERNYFGVTKGGSIEKYRVWCKTYQQWEEGNIWIGLNGGLITLCEGSPCSLDKEGYRLQRSTGRHDMSGKEVYEGDIIESHLGEKILYQNMVVRYGIYQGYCPKDQAYMDTIGFFVSAEGLPDMPIGQLEDYALVIGNIVQSPELLRNDKEKK